MRWLVTLAAVFLAAAAIYWLASSLDPAPPPGETPVTPEPSGAERPPETGARPDPTTSEELQNVRRFVERMEAVMGSQRADEEPLPELPEELKDKSEEEQRAYLLELLHHGEGMIQITSQHLEELEQRAPNDPQAAREAAEIRQNLEEGRAMMQRLRRHLRLSDDAGAPPPQ